MREKSKAWSGKGKEGKKKSQVKLEQTGRASLLKRGLSGGGSVSTEGFLKAQLAFALS